VFNFLLAATPGLIAHYQLQPVLRNRRSKSPRAETPG
jgi:hypothetical protein